MFAWTNALSPGRNAVTVDDGAGHLDSAVIYTKTGETYGSVRTLRSSNPDNPADFVPGPIQAEWPFYDNFDGTGDSTFRGIPAILAGAGWITLGRPTKPGAQTTLSFTLAPDAPLTDIFLLRTAPAAGQAAPIPTGWAETGITGTWRDNSLNLVPTVLYRRTVAPGQPVTVPALAADYLVLLKPHPVIPHLVIPHPITPWGSPLPS